MTDFLIPYNNIMNGCMKVYVHFDILLFQSYLTFYGCIIKYYHQEHRYIMYACKHPPTEYICLRLQSKIYISPKLKSHAVLFFKIVFFFFQVLKKLNPKFFFGNISLWIRSCAAIWAVFQADYEIKLCGKRETTRTF